MGVFGSPITDITLKGMPEYMNQKVITATDRARVAMQKKNAGGKDIEARNYAQRLKDDWGSGTSVLCVIYNATGNRLTLVTSHDYAGKLGKDPYPEYLENGQWGAFLHVSEVFAFTSESMAAVVYGGQNADGEGRDWLLAWDNTYGQNHDVYTMAREAGHFKKAGTWGMIKDNMWNTGLSDTSDWGGCKSKASIGNTSSPFFQGIMTLRGV